MTSSRRLIVVLGAGGRQANHVIRSLLEHADQWLVRGVTNDLRAVSIQVECCRPKLEFNFFTSLLVGSVRKECKSCPM